MPHNRVHPDDVSYRMTTIQLEGCAAPLNALKPTTVLLVDDHEIVRAGVRAVLASSDFKIIAEAENGVQAVAMAAHLCPDVVIMDISMPLLNGMEATRQICHQVATTKVLMLTSHADRSFIEKARAAGAAGYLTKDAAMSLPGAIRAICNGVPFFSPGH